MIIGDVIGSVTAPEQLPSLKAHRLLVVKRAALHGHEGFADYEVALDLVGAGPGSRVLMVSGSAARIDPETRTVSTDLSIVAIVDSIDINDSTPVRAVTRMRSATS